MSNFDHQVLFDELPRGLCECIKIRQLAKLTVLDSYKNASESERVSPHCTRLNDTCHIFTRSGIVNPNASLADGSLRSL